MTQVREATMQTLQAAIDLSKEEAASAQASMKM